MTREKRILKAIAERATAYVALAEEYEEFSKEREYYSGKAGILFGVVDILKSDIYLNQWEALTEELKK